MGLDQYAIKRKGAILESVDFGSTEGDEEIAYWRKHPNLQGWMEALYRSKGGTDGNFNCVNLALTPEDIDNLEKAVLANTLPETTGFFFGQSYPEDRDLDIAFIRKAREAFAEGYSVYYTSWW